MGSLNKRQKFTEFGKYGGGSYMLIFFVMVFYWQLFGMSWEQFELISVAGIFGWAVTWVFVFAALDRGVLTDAGGG